MSELKQLRKSSDGFYRGIAYKAKGVFGAKGGYDSKYKLSEPNLDAEKWVTLSGPYAVLEEAEIAAAQAAREAIDARLASLSS